MKYLNFELLCDIFLFSRVLNTIAIHGHTNVFHKKNTELDLQYYSKLKDYQCFKKARCLFIDIISSIKKLVTYCMTVEGTAKIKLSN